MYSLKGIWPLTPMPSKESLLGPYSRYVISQPADKTDTLMDHALLTSILLLLTVAGPCQGP